MKTVRFIAILTPVSRTSRAREAYSRSSRSGVPKSLTSSAPATLNRSVIRVPSSALAVIIVRVSSDRRRPMILAGMRKNGTSASAPRVSCQESVAIAATMSSNDTALETTDDRTDVNACWAPMTSELSRLTREPVCARVKNAIGWRSTWAKTSVRSCRISPSPIREENHRCAIPRTASATASAATSSARRTTTSPALGMTPTSTRSRNSRGTATTMPASRTTRVRKAMIERRNGRA